MALNGSGAKTGSSLNRREREMQFAGALREHFRLLGVDAAYEFFDQRGHRRGFVL